MTREEAWNLLTEYNQDPFHLEHAQIVEGLMRYFADELGYGEERDFWGIVGLLHDLDFEKYPDEHCIKSREIMRERGVDERIIHATASHGYMLTVDIRPEHEMEKVLYAVDELKWPDRGSGAYAAVEERAGSGAEVCEEEIQEQRLCCGMFQRGD